MKKIIAVDLFCGAGGTSSGLRKACIGMGIDPDTQLDLTAVNHWPVAVATHAANHPAARHINKRIEQVQPERVVPGGRADMLWASPECIEHSVAKGGRPKNDQSRCQAWTVLDWVQRLTPSTVFIENVPEFQNWGPIYASGAKKNRPIPSKKGESFYAWVKALESLNYRVEWNVLTCADYGDATTRRRFFLQARRGAGGRVCDRCCGGDQVSETYKKTEEVPTCVLCERLEVLSTAVTKGRDGIEKEFDMRVPAAVDRDADLVLSEASKRLTEQTGEIERLQTALTPSGTTKQAYIGEFKFTISESDPDGDEFLRTMIVPWTTIKEIMRAIRKEAQHGGEE